MSVCVLNSIQYIPDHDVGNESILINAHNCINRVYQLYYINTRICCYSVPVGKSRQYMSERKNYYNLVAPWESKFFQQNFESSDTV